MLTQYRFGWHSISTWLQSQHRRFLEAPRRDTGLHFISSLVQSIRTMIVLPFSQLGWQITFLWYNITRASSSTAKHFKIVYYRHKWPTYCKCSKFTAQQGLILRNIRNSLISSNTNKRITLIADLHTCQLCLLLITITFIKLL